MRDRRLLRLGAFTAVAGAAMQLVATALEPDLSDDLSKAIRTTAESGVFEVDRVIDFFGLFFMLFGLVVVGLTITEHVAAQYMRVGRSFLVLGGALGAGAVIAGASLKSIADDWAAAVAGHKETYRGAFAAVRELESGLFFGAFTALAIFLAMLAAAILISRSYAHWIGVSSAVAAGLLAAGNIGLLFVDAAFIAVLVGFVVLMVVVIALGIALWRVAAVPTGT